MLWRQVSRMEMEISLYGFSDSTGRYSFIFVFSFIVMLLLNHSTFCRVFSPYFADVSLHILQNSSLQLYSGSRLCQASNSVVCILRGCFFGFDQMTFAVSFGRRSWSSSPRIISRYEPCSAAILEVKILSCDLPDARNGRLEAGY